MIVTYLVVICIGKIDILVQLKSIIKNFFSVGL